MTYEEAIQTLNVLRKAAEENKHVPVMDTYCQAFDMAIKVLEFMQQHEDDLK